MDDNVMRVLQMLQDGKISAQEAEMLIASLRGESAPAEAAAPEPQAKPESESKQGFGGFDFDAIKIKTPKIDLDDLGERISKAVSKVQPEKIVKRVQTQLRTASRAGAHWGTSVSNKVRTWADGDDSRPTNGGELPTHSETHEQEFHLEAGAKVFVENPLGSIKVTGIEDGLASVIVQKLAWGARSEEAKAFAGKMEIVMNGTDARLDVKASAPDFFREGTVDLELRVPRGLSNLRVSARYGIVEISHIEGLAEGVTTTGSLYLHDLMGDARGETATGTLTLERILGTATVATQSGDINASDIGRGLTANTASGDVTAAGVEGGRVECKSVSGDASAERIGLAAPLEITVESISGDATLKQAAGSIGLKAVSGDVLAEEITATRLQAQTVSGDVTLRLNEAFSGTMQVNTVSGDVTLSLPEGSNARVSLSTTSGELRCDHDAHDVTATETLWTGQIGTGAGTLNVQTISGDSHIQRA